VRLRKAVGVPDAAAFTSAELMDGSAEARHKLEAEELGIIKFVGAWTVLLPAGINEK